MVLWFASSDLVGFVGWVESGLVVFVFRCSVCCLLTASVFDRSYLESMSLFLVDCLISPVFRFPVISAHEILSGTEKLVTF